MTPLEALEADILAHEVELSPQRWAALRRSLTLLEMPARACIYPEHNVGDRWLFLTSGVAASRQSNEDGSLSIARFFVPGDFCANLTSTWYQQYAQDELIAISHVQGVEVPDNLFREEYLAGDDFGRYLRFKAMTTLCFDKDLLCTKTSASAETRYRFLEQCQALVLEQARQKDVAAFLGITPQGLSRFLRRRQGGT